MQRLKSVLSCVLLASLAALAITACLLVRCATHTIRSLPAVMSAEIAATRAEIMRQIEAARIEALVTVDRQATALQARSFQQIAEIRNVADRRIGDTLTRVDRALLTIEGLRGDLQPALTNVREISTHANEASAILFRRDALPAQLLGLTAAAKVTLGQTATTMRAIQEATPQMLATVQQVGDNIKATTEASTEASRNTAQVMANFARATKPLPTWARVGLAVAPPLAQVGASVATTLAVTGKVGK